MGVLSKVTDFVGGSLFKEIKETAMAYFPPDMSPEQKAQAELAMERLAHKKEKELLQLATEAQQAMDKRIAEQEGTAKDLLQLPVVGRIVIFLRGLQRPVWGFATLAMDYHWFTSPMVFDEVTGTFMSGYTDQQQLALVLINIIVLSFLFGERAIKNLEPLIMRVFGPKGDNNQ